MEVFWARGFADASMAELSAAMGLNPPSIYAAFGSKEGLFKETVDFYVRAEGHGIWEHVDNAPTALEAVRNMLTATALAFTRHARSRGCMIVLAAPQCEGAHPSVCEELRERRAAGVKLLAERFARAVREGDLPSDASCEMLADYVAAIQHGMSILARDGTSKDALLQVANAAVAGWSGAVEASRRSHKNG